MAFPGVFGAKGFLSNTLFGDPDDNLGQTSQDMLELLLPLFEQAAGGAQNLLEGAQEFFRTGEIPGFLRAFATRGSEAARSAGSSSRQQITEQATRSGISGTELNQLLAGSTTQSELAAAGVPVNLVGSLLPMLLQLIQSPFGGNLLAQIAGRQTAGLQAAQQEQRTATNAALFGLIPSGGSIGGGAATPTTIPGGGGGGGNFGLGGFAPGGSASVQPILVNQ